MVQRVIGWTHNRCVCSSPQQHGWKSWKAQLSKAHQADTKRILAKFELLHLTTSDQQWAMQQLERFQFSHHIGKDDRLIAAVAYRLQVPLYTHNLKDMTPLIGSLAIRPYA